MTGVYHAQIVEFEKHLNIDIQHTNASVLTTRDDTKPYGCKSNNSNKNYAIIYLHDESKNDHELWFRIQFG